MDPRTAKPTPVATKAQPALRASDGAPLAGRVVRLPQRAGGVAILLVASIVLLTLAFAPVGQFYLAWVGLAPWLIFVRSARSQRSAFFWSWLAGTLFFTANMWWMYYISAYGLIALMVYCGIYWGFAALVIRGAKLLEPRRWGGPVAPLLLVPAVWVAFEWLRGNLMTGLPWLYLGHTQTPVLALCQIADVLGVYGVSFWIVLVNTLIVLALFAAPGRRVVREVLPAAAVAGLLTIGIVFYGVWRMGQTPSASSPGPTVLVAQPSWPQSNDTGQKGATDAERLEWHLSATEDGIRAAHADGKSPIDLVVWSETMMPPMNHEWVDFVTAHAGAQRGHHTVDAIGEAAARHDVTIIAGGAYAARDSIDPNGDVSVKESRNTAYYFRPDGSMDDSPGHRYDKIHLVPFGEFIPFKDSLPWVYRALLKLGPPNMEDYALHDGADNGLTVFPLTEHSTGKTIKFVTPICFEDIDARICTRMFCPDDGGTAKRADLLVNLTNDGWFKANENAQHLQVAVFRSIENRVPTARSVNTGISGFIDSDGRAHDLLPVRTFGTSTAKLSLDSRLTFYTRHGDLFAAACITTLAGVVLVGAVRGKRTQRNTKKKQGNGDFADE